jgi:hypothetical protein
MIGQNWLGLVGYLIDLLVPQKLDYLITLDASLGWLLPRIRTHGRLLRKSSNPCGSCPRSLQENQISSLVCMAGWMSLLWPWLHAPGK